ncbi:MarC family protein [Raineyella fluvialis]|uniref:UPF0056 membrane protein n=1 Tax=Raineyella fluvialis TaxID=2662261 RepID=A0A5Q2FEH0_9ACTN|nr:MarC family protein [Raineyella fluvialis]QGF22656.1 MarC family protein [Raineyella fluvialis]
MDVTLFVKALGGFFAIMNPFVALPMFLALTAADSPSQQRRTGVRVVLYSLVMSAVVMAAGSAILSFFGITVNDFRVAGGIVLMTISLGMLHGGSSAHEGSNSEKAEMRSRRPSAMAAAHSATGTPSTSGTATAGSDGTTAADASGQTTEGDADISFYPLTFPMMLGPGTITSIIVFTGQAGGIGGMVSVAVALLVVLAALFVVLWFAPAIGRRMSETLRTVMTRLMGMILAAISVAMIIAGLQQLIPALR